MNPLIAGRSMHLHLEGESTSAGHLRRCRVERMTDGRVESTETLWFELPPEINPPPVDDAEAFLLCMLLEAMQESRTLVAHGRVSHTLLSNLTEFRDAWVNWSPMSAHGEFSRIEFGADTPCSIPPAAGPRRAVVGFSGGLDSSFSVWRHHHRLAGHRTVQIQTGVMVHGFDYPLGKPDLFKASFLRNQKILSGLGYPLSSVKTNYREVSRVEWGFASCATAIVAALSFFKCDSQVVLLAASNTYAVPRYPWGTTPITDPLLSGESWQTMLDGSGYSRCDKAAALDEWVRNGHPLRVCFNTSPVDGNCGHCLKCHRTAANFLACGLSIPPQLNVSEQALTEQIRSMIVGDPSLYSDWAPILHHAEKMGIDAHWVRVLRRRLRLRLIRRGAGMLMKGR